MLFEKEVNKKGQMGVITIIIVILLIFIGFWIYSFFLNKGSSTDYPYNIEKSSFWNKLWLKDDHTTVYCFDDERFIPIIEQAQKENKKIKVSYQEYLFRGTLCSSGSENIGTVVITNIEVLT